MRADYEHHSWLFDKMFDTVYKDLKRQGRKSWPWFVHASYECACHSYESDRRERLQGCAASKMVCPVILTTSHQRSYRVQNFIDESFISRHAISTSRDDLASGFVRQSSIARRF